MTEEERIELRKQAVNEALIRVLRRRYPGWDFRVSEEKRTEQEVRNRVLVRGPE